MNNVEHNAPSSESTDIAENHKFTRSELEKILNHCINRKLAEVDTQHVLESHKRNKGYPGAVIEQSVLGYPADSARRPDLRVDGIDTELKTTGIRKARRSNIAYEAKEPVSVTAVRPEYIISEEFENSGFWEKTAHMLFVYYLYAHKVSSPTEYGDFPIKDYQFKDFEGADKERLKNDWTIVRDFIREIHRDYPQDPKSQYPRISSDLNRQKLTVIDTAPKWPNPPRFRLKRRFVSTLVEECFGAEYDKLPHTYTSFSDIDRKCHELKEHYQGKTVADLFALLNIMTGSSTAKQNSERVIVRMFEGTAKTMNKVEVFSKFNLIGKSIVLTQQGGRTEDMKLFPIDFDELQDPDATFEESSFLANFTEAQLLCIVFEEPSHGAPFIENVFKGFKRFVFSDQFIEESVRPVWERMRNLIFTHQLRNIPQKSSTGKIIYNKTGVISEAPNWPKSREGFIFLRGTGANSKDKPLIINDVHMYRQNLWIKGSYIAEQLNDIPYL